VGSDSIDAEHGIQLGLIEAAAAALKSNDHRTMELLEQLYTYSQAHFMSEQLLMRLSAQQNYHGHDREHELLLQELDEICSQAESGDYGAALGLVRAHEKNLLKHIRSWDRSIEEYPTQQA
jgi:hemerythrin